MARSPAASQAAARLPRAARVSRTRLDTRSGPAPPPVDQQHDGGQARTANATRTQWYDDGPPKTESKPLSATNRFYRVIVAPANP